MAKKKTAIPSRNGQTAIDDHPIKDEALEELCRAYFENADTRTKTQRKEYARAKVGIGAAIDGMKGLKDGDVVRVGDEFLIEVRARAGGGFAVPEWSKKIASTIRHA